MDPIKFRRHLHQHPELSFEEHATARFISEELTALGVEHRTIASTGILAKIEGKGEMSQAVVLRADIDALPITESTGLDYASCNAGVMHACGHDIHAAVLYGVVKRFVEERCEFEGTLFALFQPGEELNPGGASKILEEDPFNSYTIKAFIGEHVEYQLPVGSIGFRAGKYMASSDEIRFRVNGVGGHGAMRYKIKDPIQAAADYLLRILALNRDDLIVSVGHLEALGATNVIPQSLFMEGTMRTFDEQERRATQLKLQSIADEVDAKYGVKIEVMISHGFPCVVNDEELTREAIQEAGKDLEVVALERRTTSEDFGFYTQQYPSLFYRLGAGQEGCGAAHTSTFNPNEEAIGVGVDLMYRLATKFLNDEKR